MLDRTKWTFFANYLRFRKKELLGEWLDQDRKYTIYDESVAKDMGSRDESEPTEEELIECVRLNN